MLSTAYEALPCPVLRDLIHRGCEDKVPASAIVEITPETADYLFTHMNGSNRRPSQPIANTYAKSMARGVWDVTPQGMGIDWWAWMNDGQHRCLAATLSNTPFTTNVVTGLRPESFTHIDGGAKRNATARTNLTPPNVGVVQYLSSLVVTKRQALVEEWQQVNSVIKDALADIYADAFAGTKVKGNKFHQRHILAAATLSYLNGSLGYETPEEGQSYVKVAMAEMAVGDDGRLSPLLTQIADRIRRDKLPSEREEFGLVWYALNEGAEAPAVRRFPSMIAAAKETAHDLLSHIFE